MQNVNERLRKITLDEIKPLLDAKHDADPVAGIAIVNLSEKDLEVDRNYFPITIIYFRFFNSGYRRFFLN